MNRENQQTEQSPPGWVQWLIGIGGLRLAFMWGFMEASVFFLVPDIVISITALFGFRPALKQVGLAIVGTLLAGIPLFLWAQQDAPSARQMVLHVPFVRASMVEDVRANLVENGASALLHAATSGIPYKLFAVEAPEHISLTVFTLMTVPSRLKRLLITIAFFGGIGWFLRKQIGTHPRTALGLHLLFWVGSYSYYWSII
ncbi:MAG: hypothetical protein H8E43_11230 [Planctomycetia bacterium]|nr:hypothetical protein [Planctomycetia bacterium]MDC0347386.1 hypothetical protein [Planctomycetota bacterium]MDC3251877.1 hypothetical protein [Planctomycetota bacterium]